jgi:hypothetical protein
MDTAKKLSGNAKPKTASNPKKGIKTIKNQLSSDWHAYFI